jgi:gluconate kinase
MATRGRPAFQPTDEQRKNVEVMASLGIPEENIRLLVRNRSDTPISRNSLRKHFKKELEIGATKLNARVGHFMVTTILGTRPPDGVTPIRDERVRGRLGELFLKARLGWREVVLNQHEVPKQSKEQRLVDVGAVRRRLQERLRRFAPLPENSGEPTRT